MLYWFYDPQCRIYQELESLATFTCPLSVNLFIQQEKLSEMF